MLLMELLNDKGYSNIKQLQYERYTAIKNFQPVIVKLEHDITNEINALLELKNVNNIPRLIENFNYNNQNVIIIEFIKGDELRNLINNYDLNHKIYVCNELVKIIKNIHECGWVHGDIHVSNIIVDDDLNVSLIDFGTSFKNTYNCSYCPLYPPPDSLLLINNKYEVNPDYCMDYTTDYWALGLVIYSLFREGFIPSASNFMFPMNIDEMNDVYKPYVSHADVPNNINNMLSQLLKHNPIDRCLIC